MKPGTDISSYKAHTVSCCALAVVCQWFDSALVPKPKEARTTVESQGRVWVQKHVSSEALSSSRGRCYVGLWTTLSTVPL